MEIEEVNAIVIKEMEPFMEGMKDVLINAGVDRSSHLIESFEVVSELGTNLLIVEIVANDYIFWVDKGRGPTQSFSGDGAVKRNIKDWIDRRHITDTRSQGKKLNKDELAFLIARKIHREGYKGKEVLTSYISENEERLLSAIDKEILKLDVDS